LIQTTGNPTLTTNTFRGGTINLASGITVNGRITAANSPTITGTILNVGTGASLKGNIDVQGNIVVSGGTVIGKVTHPAGTTYSRPTPTLGNVTGTPSLPTLPTMPAITNFPAAGTKNITSTQTITPGAYNNMALPGKQTITLSGPGIYIFNAIKNTGQSNTFLFDFKNLPGDIKIYVYGDIDLNDCAVDTLNGGGSSRIYTETHGTGSTSAYGPYSWNLSSGSNQSYKAKWVGTVWAPYGGINIGIGSQATLSVGAFYSATQVNIEGNSTIIYSPYPALANTTILPYYPPPTGGKTTHLIGSELNSLYENFGVVTDSAKTIFIINQNTVQIEVIARIGQYQNLLTLLQTPAYGLTNLVNNGPNTLIITGAYPIINLRKLDSLPTLIDYCRPLFPPLGNGSILPIQGDTVMRTNFVRQGYNMSKVLKWVLFQQLQYFNGYSSNQI
jgi:hypothetical protein